MVEYLMIFPEPDAAESVASELREDEDFSDVQVGELHPHPDDLTLTEWGVIVQVDTIDDPTGAVARALSDRFTEASQEHGGRLDAVR